MYIIASPIKTIYKIVTTQKTIIIDNKIILPSKPDGDLMFNMMIVYDSNIDLMVEKALQKRNTITLEEINHQIRFVKEKHTYINRIKNILSIL